ncbi:MAG TPA: winged helix-turn-helix domain-containing protein [Thermoanaerobaculia bacterium]|nr:winged helix-turn-helix domain-containing protein [Thermoanaerobaculia bacterium]
MSIQSGFCFGDVALDSARRQLFIRGREVKCRPLAFELLLLLCEAKGAVVPREEILKRLWGETYLPSDESLTQIVHRLRTTLGEHGKVVRTVRGAGLRLDAPVVLIAEEPRMAHLPDLSTQPVKTAPASPSTTILPAGRGLRKSHAYIAAGIAMLLLAVVLPALRWNTRRSMIDPGYGVTVADLGSSSKMTEDLVRRAFAAKSRGDRAQAVNLLETAHRSDPSTPIPAAFRALWGSPETVEGERRRWALAAQKRLTRDSSPFAQLLVRYARVEAEGTAGAVRAALSALLNLRPDAWQMRLGRAHYNLAQRRNTAALADLKSIPIHEMSRGVGIVLADRASLGDLAGAERAFKTGLLAGQDALAWYVRGRFARSRLQPAAALDAFNHAMAEGIRGNQPDLALDSRLLAAISSFEAGDPAGAALRFDQTAAAARDQQRRDRESDALGLGAYLAWLRADPAGCDHRLAEAFRASPPGDELQQASLTLLSLWTGGMHPANPARVAASIDLLPESLGLRSLLFARGALSAGRPDEAGRLLRQALAEGIETTYFAEEAALLARQLGATVPVPRVDPPYPNRLRLAAAWEIQRLGHPVR